MPLPSLQVMHASCVLEVKDLDSLGQIFPSVDAHCQQVIAEERGSNATRSKRVVFCSIFSLNVLFYTKVNFFWCYLIEAFVFVLNSITFSFPHCSHFFTFNSISVRNLGIQISGPSEKNFYSQEYNKFTFSGFSF